jgi:hypothetical protein
VCNLEGIGAPSIFKLIRKAAALARILPTLSTPRWTAAGSLPEDEEKNLIFFFFKEFMH